MLTPTETQVLPSSLLLAALAQMLDTGGPFDTSTLFLFVSDTVLTPDTTIDDLVLATFDGSTPQAAIVFSDPFYDVDQTALALSADHAFICTGDTDLSQVVYGYGLANAAVDELRAAWKLASPVGIDRIGAAVPVAVFLRYSGN